MGFTTSFRMGQLLQYDFSPPAHPENKSDMAYMVTDFVDAVRKSFSSAGYLAKNSSSQESGGSWLIGYNKKLYRVDHDFQIGISALGYQSVGCGCDLALGALYATKDVIEDPKERILTALKAAAQFSGGVRSPFTILSQ